MTTDEAAGKWECPNCRSDNIQNLAVLHAAGKRTSAISTVMVGGSRSAVGAGVGESVGLSITGLAKAAAPPRRPRRPGLLGGLVGLLVGAMLGSPLGHLILPVVVISTVLG